MGYFFYGAVLGFLFSSLLYLLLALTAVPKIKGLGTWRFVIEFAFFAVPVAFVLFWWTPPDPDWIGRYRLSIKLVQIILGACTGVLARIWLARLLNADAAPPEPSTWKAAAQADAPDQKKSGVLTGPEWNWILGFIAVVVVAVLLPYLEEMIRQASSIKIGTVELTVRTEQKSQYLAMLPVSREKLVADFFVKFSEAKAVEDRLASDGRRYPEAIRAQRIAANGEFLKFYRAVLYPFTRCMFLLVNRGWDLEITKGPARALVSEWFLIAHAPEAPEMTVKRLSTMRDIAAIAVKRWSGMEPSCKPVEPMNADAGITDSFEFYRLLSHAQDFLGNRLSAIQTLERVRERFRASELNWAYSLAAFYYDEDPTLVKASEHYELALGMAADAFEKARRRIPAAGCADKAAASPPASHDCHDFNRYRAATINMKNAIAYVQAQGGRSELLRARQLATEALQGFIEQNKVSDLSRNQSYWEHLDTYAYVTMIAAARNDFAFARSDSPDAKAIACAEKIFDFLGQQASAEVSRILGQPRDDGYRANLLTTKPKVEIYNAHRVLAANLLALRRGAECDDKDKEYRAMLAGSF